MRFRFYRKNRSLNKDLTVSSFYDVNKSPEMRRNISSLIDFYKTDKIIIYDGAIKTNKHSNPSRQLL